MSRRLRVLHVVISLSPGGMENGIVNVARSLPAEDFEIHAACMERRGEFAERMPQPENVHTLGKPPGFSLAAVRALSALIARVQPHVLHSHNLGPLIYSALANWHPHVPLLQGEHAQFTADELRPRRLFQRRLFYRACDLVHTVSHSQRDELMRLGFPAEKVATVINGVDTERFQPPANRLNAKSSLGYLPNAIVMGIVGRFGAFKRHAALLEAFAKIADSQPNLHLLIVGDGGPERERIYQLAAAHPASARIRLTGFQKEPLPFYQGLDLLVVPSVNEGLSNAVLEAMACGVPVLAHSACGHGEVLTHGGDGLLADLGDGLANEITDALAHPHLQALGAAAREKAVRDFSLGAMSHGYEKIYRALAAPKQ